MVRRFTGFVLISVALVAALGTPAGAAPGDPDTTFSGDGSVATNLSGNADPAYGVAVQDDDKIVAVGRTGGQGGRWFVLRYTTSGALDPTFSGDGKAFLNWTNINDSALDVAIQSTGNIVVVGHSNDARAFAMARFTPAGVPDTTFSGDGRVTRNVAPGNALELALAVTVLDDDRIRVTGTENLRTSVYGYTADGAADTTFSGDGFATVSFGAQLSFGIDVAVDGDGKVVVVGTVGGGGAAADRTTALRLNANGTPDTTFSGDGKISLNVINGYEDATSVIPISGGLFIAGEANAKIALVQLTDAGTLDASFSGDGKAIVDLPGSYEFITDLAEGPAGTYTGVGGIGQGGGRALVAQFLPSGALDPAFSGNGWEAFNPSTGFDLATDMAVNGDGDIIGAGSVLDDSQAFLFQVEGGTGL